ncbi:hypothetical protein ACH4VS_09240 [Streptomyces hygroscopicus]|uniref:hypothetical protein n=1 Tax=Streptomyces hygroscopicus TaxID=1912 RepID=UPI000B1528BB|nr:hypothetical protein [Streptomyces hygroscopicus]GLV75333.1 hypothetical protein Shyhy02_33330 [Streptomyces hygroscopicus subsp. hygroscopicus]
MNLHAKWSGIAVGSVMAVALCIWIGEVALPWDRSERIGTGAAVGAVLAGVLTAWAAAVIGTPNRAPEPPPRPTPEPTPDPVPEPAPEPTPDPAPDPEPSIPPARTVTVTASGERSVAVQNNQGIIATGDNPTIQR